MNSLLKIRGLRTYFDGDEGTAKVLDGLDLHLERGQILGLVGESGSGKTVTAYSILRLIRPPGRIVGGEVAFDGVDLLRLPEAEMRKVRGKRISMIFQDPRGFLDPVTRVGSLLAETYRTHEQVTRREAQARSLTMMREVGLAAPERVLRAYPHELSGGMAQRVMIALALACSPQLLIADEPTTALDVTIQIEIIRLLADLRDRLGLTIMIITHNLSVVAEICDAVAVMYAGEIVEIGPADAIFEQPRHPYTLSLLTARPTLTPSERLADIPGQIPSLLAPPAACRFEPRCPLARDLCRQAAPELRTFGPERRTRCHYAEKVGEPPA